MDGIENEHFWKYKSLEDSDCLLKWIRIIGIVLDFVLTSTWFY